MDTQMARANALLPLTLTNALDAETALNNAQKTRYR